MFVSKRFRQTGRALFLNGQDGVTVVEVMFATLIFMIIMISGLQYFTIPQQINVREKMKRLAMAEAQQTIERVLTWDYIDIVPDSNETSTPVTIGNISGTRTLTIATVDDTADGTGGSDADSDTVDYKSITVDVSWNDGSNQTIQFNTRVSSFGN